MFLDVVPGVEPGSVVLLQNRNRFSPLLGYFVVKLQCDGSVGRAGSGVRGSTPDVIAILLAVLVQRNIHEFAIAGCTADVASTFGHPC